MISRRNDMSDAYNSELEKTNLEVHVDMSRQRYAIMSEKIETIDERLDAIIRDLAAFRKEQADNMTQIREENAANAQGTNKLFVGAAATVIGGLLSTILVLLIAFM
jgi:DNA anti-recombination protein RmuC